MNLVRHNPLFSVCSFVDSQFLRMNTTNTVRSKYLQTAPITQGLAQRLEGQFTEMLPALTTIMKGYAESHIYNETHLQATLDKMYEPLTIEDLHSAMPVQTRQQLHADLGLILVTTVLTPRHAWERDLVVDVCFIPVGCNPRNNTIHHVTPVRRQTLSELNDIIRQQLLPMAAWFLLDEGKEDVYCRGCVKPVMVPGLCVECLPHQRRCRHCDLPGQTQNFHGYTLHEHCIHICENTHRSTALAYTQRLFGEE